jgi:sortase A
MLTQLKKQLPNLLLLSVFLIGLCLLLYPTVSDYYNSFHQTKAIANYEETVADLDDNTLEEAWAAAEEYNQALVGRGVSRFEPTEEETEEYNQLLDISGVGTMGYIEIPTIGVKLSIYHGTGKDALQTGVGHMEGSSLPTGGESTHVILSGHRGLPSAKLFTDLDQVQVGDQFYLHILDQTFAYEVDQIRIVPPEDLSQLNIEQGKSYCTLVTCTPYSVNSHRMLVRGHLVDYKEQISVEVTREASVLDSIYVLPLLIVPMLLMLLAVLLATSRRRKEENNL